MFLWVDENAGFLFLIEEIIITGRREIFEAYSRITKIVELNSRIYK